MLQNQLYLKMFIIYLLLTNVVSFGLFAWDKQRARQGAWRIKEQTLFLWAIIGGSLGGWLGMRVFRHKTRHLKFKWGFPLIVVIQGCLIYYICR